jgi:hypothetical protein
VNTYSQKWSGCVSKKFHQDISTKIIQTVKYADDLVLMAKEETVLQGRIDRLIEIGRCYG